jgi:hypothetical protein
MEAGGKEKMKLFCIGIIISALALAASGFAADYTPTFPDDIVGYAKEEPESFYLGDEGLWDYLDGGADKFIDAGATACAVAYYQKGDDEFCLVVLSCKEGGKKVLANTYEDYETGTVGEAGSIGEGSIVFSRGNYLVMLTAYTENSRKELLAIAKAVDKEIQM